LDIVVFNEEHTVLTYEINNLIINFFNIFFLTLLVSGDSAYNFSEALKDKKFESHMLFHWYFCQWLSGDFNLCMWWYCHKWENDECPDYGYFICRDL